MKIPCFTFRESWIKFLAKLALILDTAYVIIFTRAAGPSDKPLISFFQAKKERVKSFFSVSRLSFFIS
jgi:hypothetical protein